MSGETENNVSGWTTDTLRAHVEQLIDEKVQTLEATIGGHLALGNQRWEDHAEVHGLIADAIKAALAASEKAIVKADTATEKRFESVNEFRSTLSDQAKDFATREGLASVNGELNRRLKIVEDYQVADTAAAKGKASVTGFIAPNLSSAIAVILGLITLYLLLRPPT